jgi:hypothetical protein
MNDDVKTAQKWMFGCLTEEIDAAVEDSLSQNRLEVAVSMLSDAQELMVMGEIKSASQAINRAKYLISSR